MQKGAAAVDTWTWETDGPEATAALGRWIGAAAQAGDAVLLRGPVGAGKTVLAGGILDGLDVPGPHPSPTFTLVRSRRDGRVPAWHVDLYRLADSDVASAGELLGLDEALAEDGVAVVEWAERLGAWTPADALQVVLQRSGAERRRLRLQAGGPRSRRLLAAARTAAGGVVSAD